MRLPKLVFVICLLSINLAADTPEKAILETVLATDGKTVLKHLPPAVADAIDALPEKSRVAARERLLPKHWFGAKASRVEDGVNLLRIETPNTSGLEDSKPLFIRITRQLTNGAEAVVQLESCQATCYGSIQVWMRLQEGEWRFVEVREGGRGMARFDDPEFFKNLRDEVGGGGERKAVAYLRTMNTALVTYLSTYSAFPRRLKQLSGREGEEPTAEQAMLLDQQFLVEPCVIGDYLYEYQLIGEEEYEISARPLQYTEGRHKSFFTDQSGVIRATTDNRPATKDDKPI